MVEFPLIVAVAPPTSPVAFKSPDKLASTADKFPLKEAEAALIAPLKVAVEEPVKAPVTPRVPPIVALELIVAVAPPTSPVAFKSPDKLASAALKSPLKVAEAAVIAAP